ncbi:MAG: MerR family transcriptional regulator [Gammaproteobacteria bacterium]|nr:MAG: MerR family transcriptional regulator [Gammaproteobacteria bacterium]
MDGSSGQMIMASRPKPQPRLYEIRAVSKMTGVQPVTLRAWERRYGAVETRRTSTGGRRLYTQDDVQRLSLIKSLVDLGESVGTVAVLPTDELAARLEAVLGARAGEPRPDVLVRVAVFGPRLASMLHGDFSHRGIELVAVHSDQAACETLPPDLAVDTVVLEFTGVHEDTREQVLGCMQRARASRAVVMYDFGNLASVASLKAPPIAAVRGPAEPEDIARACLVLAAPGRTRPDPDLVPETTGEIPRRRYSRARLNRLRESTTQIGCECPHHLATLVGQLYAFEDYSAECENRNAEDARMHAYLHEVTARCRGELEEALSRLIHFEGLED